MQTLCGDLTVADFLAAILGAVVRISPAVLVVLTAVVASTIS